MIVIHLGFEAVVRGFREHALLFQDGHDAQRLDEEEEQRVNLIHLQETHPGFTWINTALHLFNEINARLKVQPKVDEGPFNALTLVLLLLQDEHVVVEKLLQLLICEVDAQLLEAIELRSKKRNRCSEQAWRTQHSSCSIANSTRWDRGWDTNREPVGFQPESDNTSRKS